MHRIMIIDDDENIRRSLQRILRKQKNWHVLTSGHPLEALNIARHSKVDLFLTDYCMPGINGVEFLVFAREHNPHAMRLILSGKTDMQGMQNAINQAEIYRFLNKPINPRELIGVVQQALEYYDLKQKSRKLVAVGDKVLDLSLNEHAAIAEMSLTKDNCIEKSKDSAQ